MRGPAVVGRGREFNVQPSCIKARFHRPFSSGGGLDELQFVNGSYNGKRIDLASTVNAHLRTPSGAKVSPHWQSNDLNS